MRKRFLLQAHGTMLISGLKEQERMKRVFSGDRREVSMMLQINYQKPQHH
ncbi:hypothetical protein VAE151_630059 [Vibrio aestuarianus]|nr:hypothetical protein VAE055_420059 [Vibrio aestuarianus]CAH8219685.1 hypothetical protein VAE032_320058 [Vibrio aestuarianus]CAH8219795.1 hypothetical protein VAE128_500055 [Vibrio aestuarianus]CAH8220042.1 hypothetical protein VAE130_600058 [Vibrio aestuarianus]CAH8220126.1 hypothetical protein VAE115_370058 [Vibrio aestuarianus]